MAGDLDYLATLDDKQFNAALKRLDTTIEAERAKMDKGFFGKQLDKEVLGINKLGKAVGLGLGGGLGLAVKLVDDFAEKNAYAAVQIGKVESAWGSFTERLGRDMAAGVMHDAGPLASFITSIDNFTAKAADEVADLFNPNDRPDSGMLLEQQQFNRMLEKRVELEIELSRLGAEGVAVSGSDLAAATARFGVVREEIQRKYAKQFEGSSPEIVAMRDSAIEAAVENERAKLRKLEAISSEKRRAGELAAAKERKEREAEAKAVFRGFDFEEQALGVQRLRLLGKEQEASYAAIALDHAKQVAELERSSVLTTEQKAEAIRRVSELAGVEAGMVGLSSSTARGATTLEAGLGGSRVASMVFGVGGSGGNELLNVQKQSRDLLRNINEAIKREGGATFN